MFHSIFFYTIHSFLKRTKKNGDIYSINNYEYVHNIHDCKKSNIQNFLKIARLRWKIENQGFNDQKNNGYALEHSYSLNPNSSKNWYYLMQIGHALNQLITKSNLFFNFKKQMKTFKNYGKRLAEHLRYFEIDSSIFTSNFQIRLNTS